MEIFVHASPAAAPATVRTATGNETIEPVEHAAMPGQPVPGVLHARLPLHPAFEQVAGLRRNGEERSRAINSGLEAAIAQTQAAAEQGGCGDAAQQAFDGLVRG